MAFVPAPNIIQVEARCTRNGQKIENRININNTGPVGPTDLSDVAIQVWNWWELTYAPHISDEVNLVEVVATDMTTATGGQFTYAPDTTTFGGHGGGALPNECAMCVSLRSASRGRSARGRWYTLSVSTDTLADTNNITAVEAAGLASALQALINDIATEGRLATIVSYISDGAPRVGGPVYFPITTALIVDTLIDSMKRRKPGVGA